MACGSSHTDALPYLSASACAREGGCHRQPPVPDRCGCSSTKHEPYPPRPAPIIATRSGELVIALFTRPLSRYAAGQRITVRTGRIFRPDTPFVHYIALIVIRAQLFKQRVEIQCRCPAGSDGYPQYAHDRAGRGCHAAPAPCYLLRYSCDRNRR